MLIDLPPAGIALLTGGSLLAFLVAFRLARGEPLPKGTDRSASIPDRVMSVIELDVEVREAQDDARLQYRQALAELASGARNVHSVEALLTQHALQASFSESERLKLQRHA